MRWVTYDVDTAVQWWERLKDSKGLWAELDGTCFETFNELLLSSDLLCDFGFGYARVTGLQEGHSCRVHAAFWSKAVFSEHQVVVGAISLLGLKYKLKRIECVVPVKGKALNRYMKDYLGFAFEGTIRAYYKTESGFSDGNLYALIGGN